MASLWKHIFNPKFTNTNFAVGTSVEDVAKQARLAGYTMFVFNGKVYRTPEERDGAMSQPLGLHVKDIE